MSRLLLQPYVHVFATPDAAVLLDLRADRYRGLDGEQTRVLAALVEGWPHAGVATEVDPHAGDELADYLVREGVLTRDCQKGKTAAPVQLQDVEAPLCEWDSADLPVIRMAHVWRFGTAYGRALLSRRFRSLERTLQRLEQRKTRQLDHQSIDLKTARELTRVFRALRPFFYTARDRCLFDSLVLVEFLASHGVFPALVLGVKTTPFAAHSWVQIDRYVLNGAPWYVRAFGPILAV